MAKTVGICFAVATTCAVSGVRRLVSQIIRMGFLLSFMRHVSSGLSANTVPNGHVDLEQLMERLGQEQIDSVLLEGGGTLNWAALESGIVRFHLCGM